MSQARPESIHDHRRRAAPRRAAVARVVRMRAAGREHHRGDCPPHVVERTPARAVLACGPSTSFVYQRYGSTGAHHSRREIQSPSRVLLAPVGESRGTSSAASVRSGSSGSPTTWSRYSGQRSSTSRRRRPEASRRGLVGRGNGALWGLVVAPAIGGLLSALLVYRFAPEAAGHGTDAAIRAYHREGGRIRWQTPIIKLLASALTLGSGGSAGREGPIAQIGAGFRERARHGPRLSEKERSILLMAGVSAGIGAIFRAPFAGAIFAAEVLYREPDIEAEVLVPALLVVDRQLQRVLLGARIRSPAHRDDRVQLRGSGLAAVLRRTWRASSRSAASPT